MVSDAGGLEERSAFEPAMPYAASNATMLVPPTTAATHRPPLLAPADRRRRRASRLRCLVCGMRCSMSQARPRV